MTPLRKIIIFLIFSFLSFQTFLKAEVPYYVDFKLILNESEAGKKAQNFLKNKLENGIKVLKIKKKNFKRKKKK